MAFYLFNLQQLFDPAMIASTHYKNTSCLCTITINTFPIGTCKKTKPVKQGVRTPSKLKLLNAENPRYFGNM